MGNSRKTVPSTQFLSVGVDFLAMYQSVFSSLQETRSNDGIRPGHVVTRADDGNITENGESILNAFYRSLGLPALRDDAAIFQQFGSETADVSALTQNDTLNYFHTSELKNGSGKATFIANREAALQGLSSTKNGAVTPTNVVAGLDFMMNPAGVDSGSNGGRPSIFPAFVAGDVTVFPVARRICPLFYPGEFNEGSVPSSRAFIESVIYNSLFTTENSAAAAKLLIDNIVATTGNTSLTKELGSKNILVLRFLQKAYAAMSGAASQYFAILYFRDQLQRKVSYVPALKRSGPAVKQGYYDLQYSELVTLLKGNAEGEELLKILPVPELDRLIQSQTAELAELDSFYNMLPHNIFNTEAQISLDSSGTMDQMPSKILFADLVVDIATVDRARKASALLESLEQQRVLRNNLESVRSQLEIFSGTTTGLSIFDILSFFIAFYLLPPNHLIGLLNDTAIERLRGRSTSSAFSGIALNEVIDSRVSMQEAQAKLEELVREQLNTAQKLFVQASGNKR